MREPTDDMIDVDLVLSILNSCFHAEFDVPAFFRNHGLEFDEVPLTREDIVSHLLNGQCASRRAPGCSEVACAVRSPIKIALAVTEYYRERKRISLGDLPPPVLFCNRSDHHPAT